MTPRQRTVTRWWQFWIIVGDIRADERYFRRVTRRISLDRRDALFVDSLTLYRADAIIVPHRIIWIGTFAVDRWAVTLISYSEKGTERGSSPPRSLLGVPNVTANQSTASVLLYNGPLLCGFNVLIKGLRLVALAASRRSLRMVTGVTLG